MASIQDSNGKTLFEGSDIMVNKIQSSFKEEKEIAHDLGEEVNNDELLKDCISLEVEALQNSYTIYF